ncbi:MAG: flagellar motor switch protein FliG [Deltaproteobacteria bacterium RIFOXYA12_FULL_61_11]|nr:MAG: flagellar motor switch protein FliG [Deltaproteobacteria bacterium RIFOXYA12_FULL_61_11]
MAPKQQLTGPDKAAILVMILGEEVAGSLFQFLDDREIKKINQAIAKMGSIPNDQINNIVSEFHSLIDTSSGLLADTEYLKRVIQRTMSDDRADLLMSMLEGDDDAPLKSIQYLDSDIIAALIKKEHPQTIAVILTILDPERAGRILGHLPENMQTEVILRMATMEKISADVVREIDRSLQKEIAKMKLTAVGSNLEIGGIDPVVSMLNRMGEQAERQVLGNIEKTNPELAVQIRRKMITFEDLISIDDAGIQEILKEVKQEELVIALKSASEELKEKMFRNMSERAADMLREEMEIAGPTKVSEVIKTQQTICEIAKKLEEEGRIVIIRGDEEYV